MAATKATKKASRSGNPAKKAAAAKTASISDFKKRRSGIDIQLPSELWVKAKRVDLDTLVLHGSVPNSLMEIVNEALEKGQDMDPAAMIGVGKDEELNMDMVRDMYEMADKVVIASVIEPKVHEVPEDEADRDDNLLYVDEFDDEDKMFMFQWATGGTSDVATFRAEASASLASLAEGQGASSAAK